MTNVYTADQALSDLQEQFKLLDYKNPEHQKKMQNLMDDRPGARCLCALSLSRPRATAF